MTPDTKWKAGDARGLLAVSFFIIPQAAAAYKKNDDFSLQM